MGRNIYAVIGESPIDTRGERIGNRVTDSVKSWILSKKLADKGVAIRLISSV